MAAQPGAPSRGHPSSGMRAAMPAYLAAGRRTARPGTARPDHRLRRSAHGCGATRQRVPPCPMMPDDAHRRTRECVVPHPPSPADNPAPHAAAPNHASRRTRERAQTHPPSLPGDPATRAATPGRAYRRTRERVSACPPSLASNPIARTAAPNRADRRTRARASPHLWEQLRPRSLAVRLRKRLAPQQRPRLLQGGTLELSVPYTNPRELVMDVQRHGADAEVIAPPELRAQMREMLAGALGRYG